jgi:hypothetical protein
VQAGSGRNGLPARGLGPTLPLGWLARLPLLGDRPPNATTRRSRSMSKAPSCCTDFLRSSPALIKMSSMFRTTPCKASRRSPGIVFLALGIASTLTSLTAHLLPKSVEEFSEAGGGPDASLPRCRIVPINHSRESTSVGGPGGERGVCLLCATARRTSLGLVAWDWVACMKAGSKDNNATITHVWPGLVRNTLRRTWTSLGKYSSPSDRI